MAQMGIEPACSMVHWICGGGKLPQGFESKWGERGRAGHLAPPLADIPQMAPAVAPAKAPAAAVADFFRGRTVTALVEVIVIMAVTAIV